MFHRKAPTFDITDHPDILAALARMEQEAYARGRADALAIVVDLSESWPAVNAGEDDCPRVRAVIAALEA